MQFNKDNCFCISLLNNQKRIDNMKRRCKEINLEYSIFPAVTPDNLKENFVHYLNGGQRGCAQSHFYLWKHIIELNLSYALILEDDACFDKQFYSRLFNYESTIQDPEWDAIFLNSSESIVPPFQWSPIKEHYLTGGYILSKNGAIKLVNMFSDCLFGADWMTSRLQEYNHCYGFFPWIIIQDGIETLIGSNLDADREKVVRLLDELNYSLDNYII